LNVNLRAKNKLAKNGKFSTREKHDSPHHNSPQIHHDFTIKTPQKTHAFRPTPIKKALINPEKTGP
jgi:hypothetical protein